MMLGDDGTAKVRIRRHFQGGQNFDAVVGVDLYNKEDEQDLYEYVSTGCPWVLVMALRRNRAAPDHIGRICGNCALIQLNANRHFFAEQPRGSNVLGSPTCKEYARTTIPQATMDMCAHCYAVNIEVN